MIYDEYMNGEVVTPAMMRNLFHGGRLVVPTVGDLPSPVGGAISTRQIAYVIAEGIEYEYREAYSLANTGGASSAGWWPKRRMFVARRTASQALAAGWFVLGSNGSLTESRNDGLGQFANGAFTVTAPGTYRIHAQFRLANTSPSPMAIELAKNSTTPDSAGSMVNHLINSSGTGLEADAVEPLAAGDVIRCLGYTNAANSIDTFGVRGGHLSIERIE